jgi:hypothetical protein
VSGWLLLMVLCNNQDAEPTIKSALERRVLGDTYGETQA